MVEVALGKVGAARGAQRRRGEGRMRRGCGEASIQPAGCPRDKKQTALNGQGTLPVPDVHHPAERAGELSAHPPVSRTMRRTGPGGHKERIWEAVKTGPDGI